jgi:hypothetical protein
MYVTGSFSRFAHIALMGDPSLRLHPVKPPSSLSTIVNNNEVRLNWHRSPDNAVSGYYIYRSDSLSGSFSLLTQTAVTDTQYLWTSAKAGKSILMVRAQKLEIGGSASYYNLSSAAFDSVVVNSSTTSELSVVTDPLNLKISPNPAGAFVCLLIAEQVVIFDIKGREIYSHLNTAGKLIPQTVNVSSWPRGVYLVKIFSGNMSVTKKLFLQ